MYASANLKLADRLREAMEEAAPFGKPIIGCFTAPPGIWDEPIRALDRRKGMAILATPERAAQAMANLWKMEQLAPPEG
jgi:hypothetical protein